MLRLILLTFALVCFVLATLPMTQAYQNASVKPLFVSPI